MSGFPLYPDLAGVTSVARLVPDFRRAGIYVLHFANGELYVGETSNMATRFAQHAKTWDDIVALAFKAKAVDAAVRRQLEADECHRLQDLGYRLRNATCGPRTETAPSGEGFAPDGAVRRALGRLWPRRGR